MSSGFKSAASVKKLAGAKRAADRARQTRDGYNTARTAAAAPNAQRARLAKAAAVEGLTRLIQAKTGGLVPAPVVRKLLNIAFWLISVSITFGGITLLAAFFAIFGGSIDGYEPPEADSFAATDIPEPYLDAYLAAAGDYALPWPVLAGIGKATTDHGRTSPYDPLTGHGGRIDRDPDQGRTDDALYQVDRSGGEEDEDPVGVYICDGLGCGPRPLIGEGPDEGHGPLLLLPAAQQAGSSAHDIYDSLDLVAETLSDIRDQLLDEDPSRWAEKREDTTVADEFWTEAVGRLDTLIADPSGSAASCGLPPTAPTSPAEVAAWIDAQMRCAALDLDDDLRVATTLNDGEAGYELVTTDGLSAVDLLSREARAVSWAYSRWDLDGCDAEARTGGIFPAVSDDQSGYCDPVANIETAVTALLTAQHDSVSDDTPEGWGALVGGWQLFPTVLGTAEQRDMFERSGSHRTTTLTDACASEVRAAARTLFDTPEAELLLDPERADSPEADTLLRQAGIHPSEAPCAHEMDATPDAIATVLEDMRREKAQQLLAAGDGFDGEVDFGDQDVGEATFDDAAQLPSAEELATLEQESELLGVLADRFSSTPLQVEWGDTPILPRLSAFELAPLPQPTPARLAGAGTSNLGRSAVAAAISYGGTIPGDDRVGQVSAAGGLPSCSGNWPPLPEGPTPAQVAQRVYEVFYCETAAEGLDQQAPTLPDYSFTNLAQQVASEAVVVGWCESAGFASQNLSSDNAWGYGGVFQMGDRETATFVPGEDKFDVHANIVGAARYFIHGSSDATWRGWRPWAVVNNGFATARDRNGNMPNYHVRYPALPGFPSQHPETTGEENPHPLPAWAVNPYLPDFPPSFADTNGCPASAGNPWPGPPGTLEAPPSELPTHITPSGGGLICPVPSRQTSFTNDWHFGRSGGRLHMGNDVFAPDGSPIVAPADGVVDWLNLDGAGTQLGNPGIAIVLDDGSRWLFLHNRIGGTPSHLQVGSRVQAGEKIGEVGAEGNARGTPPHAHTELRPDGPGTERINPFFILQDICPDARTG